MERHLNILVQSSDYYAPFAGVMLTSLFENNKDMDCITVYLMTSDMLEKNRGRFQTLALQYQRTIKFIDTEEIDSFLENNHVPKHNGAYATYYKIFALSVIEDKLDRLIYLDSDMVVSGSLSELLTWDLGENALGMCIDSVPSRYKKIIKCDSEYYYNAGMIVFNVNRWMEVNGENRIIDHITNTNAAYPIVDQDLLNIVFSGKIQTLPLGYNFNTGILWFKDYKFFISAHGVENYYTEEEFLHAKKEPIILHCLATFGTRPWYKSDHAAKKIWCKYLEISAWKDYTFIKGNAAFIQKIQGYLFKYTPKNFFSVVNRIALYLNLKGILKRLRAKE